MINTQPWYFDDKVRLDNSASPCRGLSLKKFLALLVFYSLLHAHALVAVADDSASRSSSAFKESIESDIKLGYLKRAEASVLSFRKIIDVEENWRIPYFMYLINEAKQNFGAAKKYILQAYNLNPKNPQILLAVASLKGREGNFKLALHNLNQAIYLKPNYANAYSNRGVVKGALGDTKGAIRDFTRAIKIDKFNSLAYQNRGISYEIVGDLKNACRDWKSASRLGLERSKTWLSEQCKKNPPLR